MGNRTESLTKDFLTLISSSSVLKNARIEIVYSSSFQANSSSSSSSLFSPSVVRQGARSCPSKLPSLRRESYCFFSPVSSVLLCSRFRASLIFCAVTTIELLLLTTRALPYNSFFKYASSNSSSSLLSSFSSTTSAAWLEPR